jgi:hypothetical protein
MAGGDQLASGESFGPITAEEIPFASDSCPDRSDVGASAVTLWLASHRWIHRRAETMRLEDASVGSRSVHISFTVPSTCPAFELGGNSYCCLPVSLLRKQKVNLFSLTDGSGVEYPLISRDTRGIVAAAGLVRIASGMVKAALRPTLPQDVEDDIRKAAEGTPEEAIEAMGRMENRPPSPDPVSAACRAFLFGSEPFRLALWSLALNTMILVRLPYEPGIMRTMTATYDEPLNEMAPGGGTQRVMRTAVRTIGLSPKKLWFPARVLPRTSSNHYRLTAPDGLQISTATLAVEELESSSPPRPENKPGRQLSVQGRIGRFDEWEKRDRETGSMGGVHLYDRALPEYRVALIRANLRPTPGGTLRAIWLTAAVSLAMLVVTDVALGSIRMESESSTAAQGASALLLLIPTLLAAYIARPGEHNFTSELLFGTRLLGLVAGGTTLVAACYLVLSDPHRKLGGNWTTLVVIAAFVFALLTVSYLFNWLMRFPERPPGTASSRTAKVWFRGWTWLRQRLEGL